MKAGENFLCLLKGWEIQTGFYRRLSSSSSTSVLEFKIWSAISKGTYAFLFIQCFFRKRIALRTNASAPFEQLLSSTHNYKKHFSVSQVSVVGTNSRRVCEREKEAAEEIAVWTLLFFAGCVPHTGSIWSCQAKGPGFAFCWNLSDSFPHVVPWGEFRDKSLGSCFILLTDAIRVQEYFFNFTPVKCSPGIFPSILLLVKEVDSICEETWLPPSPHVCALKHAHFKQLFLLFFILGAYVRGKGR